jgi:hypothetical protein
MTHTTKDCGAVLDQAFPTLTPKLNAAGNPYVACHGFEIAVCPTPSDKGKTMSVTLCTPEAPGMAGTLVSPAHPLTFRTNRRFL